MLTSKIRVPVLLPEGIKGEKGRKKAIEILVSPSGLKGGRLACLSVCLFVYF